MLVWVTCCCLLGADAAPQFTSPRLTTAEQGYGLSQQDAAEGWLSLFDGASDFGWSNAKVERGRLLAGVTNMRFGPGSWKIDLESPGKVRIGGKTHELPAGVSRFEHKGATAGIVYLEPGLRLRGIHFQPLGLRTIFNGKDLSGWDQRVRDEGNPLQQTTWKVEGGAIRGVAGPGALEYRKSKFADMVLQIDVRTNKPLVNGGVFFRAIPGEFMNGYEAQIFNACYDHDPSRPAEFSTGALDDRQNARRLVSRDEQQFTLTVMAVGNRIATWVNGYQQTDWQDLREPHENPRQGARTKVGSIQLQSHDPQSDLQFLNIHAAEIEAE